jgi:hypothetical protein
MQLLVLTSLAAENIKWQFKSREISYAIQSYGSQKEFSCL